MLIADLPCEHERAAGLDFGEVIVCGHGVEEENLVVCMKDFGVWSRWEGDDVICTEIILFPRQILLLQIEMKRLSRVQGTRADV